MTNQFRIMKRGLGGLTLVEILVALAVLGVLLAVAAPSLRDLMERRRVIAAAGEIAGIFNYARSESNAIADVLKLHLEPMGGVAQASCARLVLRRNFDNCGCDVPLNEVCNTSAKMLREFILPTSTGVSFAAQADWGPLGVHAVTFGRNQYYTDVQNVTVTVTGARTGAELRIEYNNVGRVRTCSPGGIIGGYPACT